MMKLFVTGATGVLGRRVVPALVDAGHGVVAVARTDDKAARLTTAGATPVSVDLFDPDQVAGAVAGCDAVLHLATHIPTGASAARRGAWKTNDRLRIEASAILAAAALDAGVRRYIGESITFPYVDAGSEWIDEAHDRRYFAGNRSCVDAEASAASVTAAGGTGVVLRFAMFHAADSAHVSTFLSMARKGLSPFFGKPDAYISFIDTGDAARAVVAALELPPGIYNVAEAEPTTRAAHAEALARAIGRTRLRRAPTAIQRLGGDAVDSLSRSQRVSSKALCEASGWTPKVVVIDRWKSLV